MLGDKLEISVVSVIDEVMERFRTRMEPRSIHDHTICGKCGVVWCNAGIPGYVVHNAGALAPKRRIEVQGPLERTYGDARLNLLLCEQSISFTFGWLDGELQPN